MSALLSASFAQICEWRIRLGMMMIARLVVARVALGMGLAMLIPLGLGAIGNARAQDVPGIEICTVEKTMERRTSCLQSNVDFLQKTISKLTTDHQQKLDAANRQIEILKSAVVGLQKVVADLQTAQGKLADDLKKKQDVPPAKDAASAAKEGAK